MRWKIPPRFQTGHEIDRYYSGMMIQCLICGHLFRRLVSHISAKHGMTAAEYKGQFGLAWTRGLTSATSHVNSGWTEERRAKASKAARKSRFFKFAHDGKQRREVAPFLKTESVKALGVYAAGFGKKFELRVCALFDKGLLDREIAEALRVNRMTVNQRTKQWRKAKRKR
jgi:hypothetical protein